MKKNALRCFMALIVVIVALAVTSCSQWGDPYTAYDENGKNISVRYLANGGIINSGADALVDVFAKNASGSHKLISPESAERGKSQVTLSHPQDYQFAGWYVAEPVVDANGNALDEDGNLVSESGKAPAYSTGKRWDFSADKVSFDPDGEYSATEPTLTLMAMWVPKFTFEIYAQNDSGAWEIINSVTSIAIELPKWSGGKINMRGFPTYPNMTFKAAYSDPEMQNLITDSSISGEIDYEHGVVANPVVKVYTEWYEGTWFMIENAAQLYSNARPSGNYMLLNDIDMAGELWPRVFSQNTFTGKIIGNGHKISNVIADQQGNYKRDSYGLFGTIGATAEFRDVTFENISYKVSGALNEAGFGLFAGYVTTGAVFENVSISGGKLILSESLLTEVTMVNNLQMGMFNISLILGSGSADITVDGVSCVLEVENESVQVTVSTDGTVTVAFLE